MKTETLYAMFKAGISHHDADALRKISMTLQRWHELSCGISDGNGGTLAIQRDEETGKPVGYRRNRAGEVSRYPVSDRETGALKRLAAIMENYPELKAYHQEDPQGTALYIIRPGDVPEGSEVDSCYSNGIAVYK